MYALLNPIDKSFYLDAFENLDEAEAVAKQQYDLHRHVYDVVQLSPPKKAGKAKAK